MAENRKDGEDVPQAAPLEGIRRYGSKRTLGRLRVVLVSAQVEFLPE